MSRITSDSTKIIISDSIARLPPGIFSGPWAARCLKITPCGGDDGCVCFVFLFLSQVLRPSPKGSAGVIFAAVFVGFSTRYLVFYHFVLVLFQAHRNLRKVLYYL